MIGFVNKAISLILPILILSSCGLKFGPGYSMNDPMYFSKAPYLEKDTSIYRLKWTYGEMGFYFTPKCIVRDSSLLCSLQSTTSTGMRKGKSGEIIISDPEHINAIESGRAFWVEPDGSRFRLKLIN